MADGNAKLVVACKRANPPFNDGELQALREAAAHYNMQMMCGHISGSASAKIVVDGNSVPLIQEALSHPLPVFDNNGPVLADRTGRVKRRVDARRLNDAIQIAQKQFQIDTAGLANAIRPITGDRAAELPLLPVEVTLPRIPDYNAPVRER